MHWLIAVVLGLVEGITEFIPVSSTGHLLLTEQFLKLDGKPLDETFFGTEIFNAVIQVGAMLAALPLFRPRLRMLRRWWDPDTRDYFLKMIVAFGITVAGALILKKLRFQLPHTVFPIAMALLIGGIAFLFVERWIRERPGTNEITWTLAVVFGLAQIIAVAFPGSSRSGSTIIFALALGLARAPAVEFSFLLGVPTLCAAGAKTMLDALKAHETILWGPLIVTTLVAAVSSFFAVGWLLRYVQSHTFIGFGLYRIGVGVFLLVAFWALA
ncbi:MAG TPA: undecaprenyl-diphosphate phosphatase [Chthoniobacteraceae bacterium]|nr:undecaprenyl-diphosphate phosphatase [Chthoniobacteraceae bacterium]